MQDSPDDLKKIGEFGLIECLSAGCLVRRTGVVKGIGDDAAAIRPEPGKLYLITTDLLVERVHFLRNATEPEDLGHKSLAVNLSDIAAMGGRARDAFISLAVPGDTTYSYVERFYSGIKALAKRYSVNILGGDTTSSKTDFVINITVTGEVAEDEMLTRDAALPGDAIAVTGNLGDSRAGLYIILKGITPIKDFERRVVRSHVRPDPCLAQGRFFAKIKGIRTGIDISDGLVADLGHVLKESKRGALIYEEALPLSDPLKRFCADHSVSPHEFALSGGEDYQLLLTIPRNIVDETVKAYQSLFGSPLHIIGEITEGEEGIIIIDKEGRKRVAISRGWDHFRPEDQEG